MHEAKKVTMDCMHEAIIEKLGEPRAKYLLPVGTEQQNSRASLT